jgi:hypothetical protein
MHNDDLNEILRRMCPQGFAILRFEHGTEMLRMGARELINNPSMALEALGPKGTRAFARAVGALGERYTAIRERLDELAAEGEAAAAGSSGPCDGEEPQ